MRDRTGSPVFNYVWPNVIMTCAITYYIQCISQNLGQLKVPPIIPKIAHEVLALNFSNYLTSPPHFLIARLKFFGIQELLNRTSLSQAKNSPSKIQKVCPATLRQTSTVQPLISNAYSNTMPLYSGVSLLFSLGLAPHVTFLPFLLSVSHLWDLPYPWTLTSNRRCRE